MTQPLSTALDSGRINHAYLFSGPRGCGKTSSARILARSLNCVEGPTSTPCGVCNSCVSLAPGGAGNLDVTELDAASHNGVEDMRELRDRAFYAPAESRYRVFIIDEAHMITNAGSNALLKIVEEPPEHLIFIFATTEPEKVIGTIRSRTHHYPFRLLTSQAMRGLLERVCTSEGVTVEDSVFPLVIRAGGGSPRDSLSILDQLLSGAGPEGLTYKQALPLLGVTDSSLIDETISALANKDEAAMFVTIDKVIEAGHDPRRFITDLLDRLRDLMIVQSVPQAFDLGLVAAPTDQKDILVNQAALFKDAELLTLASIVNDGIDDMRGATSPRLLLEILGARLILSAPTSVSNQATTDATSGLTGPAAARAVMEALKAENSQPDPESVAAPEPERQPEPEPTPEPSETEPPTDLLEVIRKRWAQLRSLISKENPRAGIMLTEAKVLGFDHNTLTLGHSTGALAKRLNAPEHNETIVKVLNQELGQSFAVEVQVGSKVQAASRQSESSPAKPVWKPKNATSREENPTVEEPERSAETAESEPDVVGVDKREVDKREERENPAGNELSAEISAEDIPLPPEPDDEEYEEEFLAKDEQSPGELDHRDATTIATELLAQELGAKPL